MRYSSKIFLAAIGIAAFANSLTAQISTRYTGYIPSGFYGRPTTKSNYYIWLYNDGLVGNNPRSSITGLAYWPRSLEMIPAGGDFWFGCKKENRKLVSSQSTQSQDKGKSSPLFYSQFVPGVIGDPKAKGDTAFGGIGWKYRDDPNYIVYASTDYDPKGVDQSGNNFPDWPMRLVNGKEEYVQEITERGKYPAVYKSDEDFFCVFKDTETDADPEYRGPNANADSFSIPIGIEVRLHCYTWSQPLFRDAIVVVYEIMNKSGKKLDDCFVFSPLGCIVNIRPRFLADTAYYRYYPGTAKQSMYYNYANYYLPPEYSSHYQPYSASCYLESPRDQSNSELGITMWKYLFLPQQLYGVISDRNRYDYALRQPHINPDWAQYYGLTVADTVQLGITIGTGPFNMEPGATVRIAVVGIVTNGFDQLKGMRNIIQRVYDHNMQLPAPPTQPKLTKAPSPEGILLKWDSTAELSHDPIIDDTLGNPFMGYRLYRSVSAKGPFVKIKEWRTGRDSIVHKYLDNGRDGADSTISGLKMNVSYYYKLTAFDEGAPSIGFPEMESEGIATPGVPSAPASSPYDLSNIRIVPNPYIVTHAAQQSIDHPKLFFNYLPEECTIRIYTVALELVAELHHHGGSAEEWDLRTQGGQQVASQLLIAQIETPQGTAVVKKFAVVLAE